MPDVRGDDLGAGQDGDVLEHRLATIAEARRLDGDRSEQPTDAVDHQRGERLAVDVLGNDQQRLLRLRDLLQQRQQVADRGDLALVQQHVRVIERGFHPLGVGNEVRRDVALVELHALGELELDAGGLALVDGDDAVLADLVHRLRDQVTDRTVLRGDGRDIRDLCSVGNLARDVAQRVGHSS